MKETRLGIRVDEKLKLRVDAVAKRIGVSHSDMVRMALIRGLPAYEEFIEDQPQAACFKKPEETEDEAE